MQYGGANQEDATSLMLAATDGDAEAAGLLMPLVYKQLRQLAQKELARERPGHTLSATALVHDAYLRLVGPRKVPWSGRRHYYAAAAQAMRRILIDHARSRSAPARRTVSLTDISDVGALATASADQILALEAAVQRLEAVDSEAATVVRLRFFAGLSVEQTADAIGVSPRTTARVWKYARAVLFTELAEAAEREQPRNPDDAPERRAAEPESHDE